MHLYSLVRIGSKKSKDFEVIRWDTESGACWALRVLRLNAAILAAQRNRFLADLEPAYWSRRPDIDLISGRGTKFIKPSKLEIFLDLFAGCVGQIPSNFLKENQAIVVQFLIREI